MPRWWPRAAGFKGDLSRVLGLDVPPAPGRSSADAAGGQPDPRFRLIGVVAPRSAGAPADGLALIAIDGKPAKAYRVGTVVDGELVLQAVQRAARRCGPRGQPAQVDLQLPALPPPSTGTMPGPAGIAPVPRAGLPVPPRLPSVPPLPQAVAPPDAVPEPAESPADRPPT